MTEPLALAMGHVRNAVWQLMGNNQPDGLTLGLECLDLEAILSPDDTEPAVVPCESTPAQSLAAARAVLGQIPDQVAPAAWAVLASLTAKLG
jgi:hypothetical protein